MEIDDSPKPFLCPAPSCGSRYVRKGDLKVHFLKKHKTLEGGFPDLLRSKSTKSGKKHACPVPECNCGYMRYGDLKSHFVAHHKDRISEFPELAAENESPSVCRVPNCSIRCTNESALETHMRLFHPDIDSPISQLGKSAPAVSTKHTASPSLPMILSPMMPQSMSYINLHPNGPQSNRQFASLLQSSSPSLSYLPQSGKLPSVSQAMYQPMNGLSSLPSLFSHHSQMSLSNTSVINPEFNWSKLERPLMGFEQSMDDYASSTSSSSSAVTPRSLVDLTTPSFSATREMN